MKFLTYVASSCIRQQKGYSNYATTNTICIYISESVAAQRGPHDSYTYICIITNCIVLISHVARIRQLHVWLQLLPLLTVYGFAYDHKKELREKGT